MCCVGVIGGQFVRSKPLDFSAQGGLWIPCAGSVTPWETHLGSEEYEPDAKAFYEATGAVSSSIRDFLRYFGVYQSSVTKQEAIDAGWYPYQYGYLWETRVSADFTETTTKLYAHGRLAYELGYVMPDEKTVYGTDDGANVMNSMFVASVAKDITEGVGYCAKYTQTSPDGGAAIHWTADIEWLEMPTATHAEVEAAIKTTTFADLFYSAGCAADGSCTDASFRPTNTGKGCECLKPVPGKERLAAVFEKRRYAGKHKSHAMLVRCCHDRVRQQDHPPTHAPPWCCSAHMFSCSHVHMFTCSHVHTTD